MSIVELSQPTLVKTDVLVIGGGGAGLRAAIEARKCGVSVLLVAKSRVGYGCNTSISRGAFAAAIGLRDSRDSQQVHLRDTILGGRFINDQRLVEVVISGVSEQVQDMADFGVTFSQKEGGIQQVMTPGHTYPRNVRSERGFGQDFTIPLRNNALKMGCELAEGVWIIHLLERGGVVAGAMGVDRKGQALIFQSKATVLATGGGGQVYLNTDNAGGMTGDGYALAYEMGLPLSDMEFVQFYPTALGRLGRKLLSYEALVGRLDATLRNSLGEDIVDRHRLQDAMRMTRGNLSRAIFQEILEGRDVGGGVILDLSTIPPEKAERAREQLGSWNSGASEPVIVAPTCHFFMGGVKISEQGQTAREGLWAAGEVCAGVHGANRLAGNAIAEILVFGAIAGRGAASWAGKVASTEVEAEGVDKALEDLKSLTSSRGSEMETEIREEMKKTMWFHAGIVREEGELRKSLEKLFSLRKTLPQVRVKEPRQLHRVVELRNMLLVSEMICRAALMRTESRGSHFRIDYPEENDRDWLKNIVITRRGQGMELILSSP